MGPSLSRKAGEGIPSGGRMLAIVNTPAGPEPVAIREVAEPEVRALRQGAPLLGTRVLITGAAGGVGNLAVQLVARSGARVTAIVGNAERGRVVDGLGAAEVVTTIEAAEGRFGLILEAAGGASL